MFSLDSHLVRWSPDGDNYAVVINDKVDIYELETASVTVTITNPKRISSIQFLNVGPLQLDIFLCCIDITAVKRVTHKWCSINDM